MSDAADPSEAPHPGSVLRTEFLDPHGLSANALALALRVPAPRISELVRGRRGMTPDTALRLAAAFGTSADFWLSLQTAHDLAIARAANGARITAEVEPVIGSDKPSRKAIKNVVKRYS